MLEPVAHMMVIGDEADDLALVVTDLRNVRTEMGRRYGLLRADGPRP